MFAFYRKLIHYVPEKRGFLYLTAIASLLSAFLQIGAYGLLGRFLEELFQGASFSILRSTALRCTFFLLFAGLLYAVSGAFSHLFAFRLESNLRKNAVQGLRRASFCYLDQHPSGETRRFMDDNASMTHVAVAHLIPDNIGAMLMPLLTLVLAFYLRWTVGLAVLLYTVACVLLLKGMMGNQEFMKIYQQSLDELSAETVEYVRGMQVIKIFGVDVKSLDSLYKAIERYSQHALGYSMSCRIPYNLVLLISYSSFPILLLVGLALPSFFSGGPQLVVDLLMIFFLISLLFVYLLKIMYIHMHLFEAKTAVEKMEKMYQEMQENLLQWGKREDFDDFTIEFDQICFSYHEDQPVFDHLSLRLEEGKAYALVGRSGGGKSTLAKLLSGFYPLQGGELRIGGKPLATYSEKAIAREIACVFQDVRLFQKSIYDNVALAREGASYEEVMEALEAAGCGSILDKFPQRERSLIGSEGVYLSGGEKQRIAIARAILKNAHIIVFDEATSAIDPDHEHELQKAFSRLMKGKTVIMIAHRLSAIQDMDEILLLDEGKVLERGSHQDLMEKQGQYAALQAAYQQTNTWRIRR